MGTLVFPRRRLVLAVDHDIDTQVAQDIARAESLSPPLLLVIVIGAFSTSGITFIKMIGVGMIIMLLLDATVVRALLVPATMRLLGSYN